MLVSAIRRFAHSDGDRCFFCHAEGKTEEIGTKHMGHVKIEEHGLCDADFMQNRSAQES